MLFIDDPLGFCLSSVSEWGGGERHELRMCSVLVGLFQPGGQAPVCKCLSIYRWHAFIRGYDARWLLGKVRSGGPWLPVVNLWHACAVELRSIGSLARRKERAGGSQCETLGQDL